MSYRDKMKKKVKQTQVILLGKQKKLSDNHKNILSQEAKLTIAIDFLKDLITADETGSSKGRSKEKVKDEVITFINELI